MTKIMRLYIHMTLMKKTLITLTMITKLFVLPTYFISSYNQFIEKYKQRFFQNKDQIAFRLHLLIQKFEDAKLQTLKLNHDFQTFYDQTRLEKRQKYPSIFQQIIKKRRNNEGIQWHHPLQRGYGLYDKLCQAWLIHFNQIKFDKSFGKLDKTRISGIDLHCMKKVEAFSLLRHVLQQAMKNGKQIIYVMTGRGKKITILTQQIRELKLFRYIRDEFLKQKGVKEKISNIQSNQELGSIFVYLKKI